MFIAKWPDVLELESRRNMLVSRNLKVLVRSFHAQSGDLIVATSEATGHLGEGQTDIYTEVNINHDKAKQLAQARLRKLMSHELCTHGMIPGVPALNGQSKIRIEGTGTAFDADLYPFRASSRHRCCRGAWPTYPVAGGSSLGVVHTTYEVEDRVTLLFAIGRLLDWLCAD